MKKAHLVYENVMLLPSVFTPLFSWLESEKRKRESENENTVKNGMGVPQMWTLTESIQGIVCIKTSQLYHEDLVSYKKNNGSVYHKKNLYWVMDYRQILG